MRLNRAAAIAVTLFGIGCDDGLEPLRVIEPAEDAIVDRTLVRVRSSSPDDLYSSGTGTGEFSTSIRAHANWRINGGKDVEVIRPTLDRHPDAPFMFGAILAPGPTTLEVGNCDAFDMCTWAAREVTVELRAGSPDPAFVRSGQLVVPDLARVTYPTPLSDGRVLLATDDPTLGPVIRRLGTDGDPDRTFGDDGVVVLPAYLGTAFRVVVRPTGGYLVFLIDRVVGLDENGARDLDFGTDGVVLLTAPAGAIRSVSALAPQQAGGFTLTGITQLDPQDYQRTERFVLTLDAAGAQSGYVTLDGSGVPLIDTAVDADGFVISLDQDRLRIDGVAGPDLTFGTGGALQLSPGSGAIAVWFHGDEVVVAHELGGGARLTFISRQGVIGSGLELPLDVASSSLLLATAPDGALYAAATRRHPMEPASLVRDNIDGSDFAVVRVVNQAIDASFGDGGIAHASFMLARDPIVLETIHDRPYALVVGSDGAPWLSGLSFGIDTDERAWLRRVDTQVVVARFLP